MIARSAGLWPILLRLGPPRASPQNLTGFLDEDMLRRVEFERFPITRPRVIEQRSRP